MVTVMAVVSLTGRVFGSPGEEEEGQLPLFWWPLAEPLKVSFAVTRREL